MDGLYVGANMYEISDTDLSDWDGGVVADARSGMSLTPVDNQLRHPKSIGVPKDTLNCKHSIHRSRVLRAVNKRIQAIGDARILPFWFHCVGLYTKESPFVDLIERE